MTAKTPMHGDDETQVLAAWRALPKVEPPAALDQRILAAARAQAAGPAQAATTPAAGIQPRRRPQWPALLATAAVITLAVGVSWQLRQEHPGVATPPAPAIAPPPLLERSEQKASTSSGAEFARRQAAAETDAGPAAASADLATASGVAPLDAEVRTEPKAQTSTSNEAAAADVAVTATEAAPMLQSAPVPQAKREALVPQAAPPAATAASMPPPAAAPAPPARAADTLGSAQPASPAEPAAAGAPVVAESMDTVAAAVARIRELVAAGRIAEARDAAAEFTVDHPQARLPDDLAWLVAPR